MKSADFVHLHNHTAYSLLDGMCRIPELLKRAKEYNMHSLAITDHGCMFGAIEFYTTALSSGIKPIIGCEMYIAPGDRKEKNVNNKGVVSYHLTFLCKNKVGYKNLMKLNSIGYLEGFYYKPRIDKEILAKYSEGLIVLSGCLKGEIPMKLLNDDEKGAIEVAGKMEEILGKGNFYLELMDLSLPEQKKVNEGLKRISQELSIPVVVTNDIHYLKKEDSFSHDALLCIQTQALLKDENRLKFRSDEFYFKSQEEMKNLFADIPEGLRNTVEIAEKCNLELEFNKFHLPHFPLPEGETLNSYFAFLCYEGLKERIPSIDEKIKERLEYEISVIKKMGLSGYFLIVHDFIKFARLKEIPVGPGRGSIGASLVAFSLGITDINPLEYGLIFERFLNPHRKKMPDIDVDFCDTKRNEVIDYVANKYGKDKVAQIITFGTMQARAVVRDAGRVLDIPYAEVDQIAKRISSESASLSNAIDKDEEMKTLEKKYPTLFSISKTLEGLPRHASTHAAGIVIAPELLTEYTPLYSAKEGEVLTQYSMETLDKIGLLKIDILGIKTLTVIQDTVQKVKSDLEIDVDLKRLPMDDTKTYELLGEAKTTGVFQLGEWGMRELLKKMHPQGFRDLIALLALHRPGPLGGGQVEEFIKRRVGTGQIDYLHPSMKPILEETYGVILYQEQVMKIASELAHFSMEDADDLRVAMGKKIPEVMDEKREKFVKGAKKNGISESIANKIFDYIAYFAGYGFNKAHSTAYAFLSYQTAYLKANFPLQFMASLLTAESGNKDKIALIIKECREMGIEILPPDINDSFADFTVVKGNIRFGLAAVKNVGRTSVEAIIKVRKEKGDFASLNDFIERVDTQKVTKKVTESLIKCGAFDSLNKDRGGLLTILEEILNRNRRGKRKGEIFLFGTPNEEKFEQETQSLTIAEILEFEKELLGFYLTGHPLSKHQEILKSYTNITTSTIGMVNNIGFIRIGGIVTDAKKKFTKKETKRMAILKLEDMEGSIEVVVFPDTYENGKLHIRNGAEVIVEGRIDKQGEFSKIIATSILPIKEAVEKLKPIVEVSNKKVNNKKEASNKKEERKSLHIHILEEKTKEEILEGLREILKNQQGESRVYLHLHIEGEEIILLAGKAVRVEPSSSLLNNIEKLLGEGCVSYF